MFRLAPKVGGFGMSMQRIGVIYNPLSEGSVRVSKELATWLQSRNLEVWRGVSAEGRADPAVMQNLDLLVALGGDGTVLRAARLAIPYNIPVLAVALGHLNFMAELSPAEMMSGIQTLLDGGGWRDERALIEASLERDGKRLHTFTAVNEVLVASGPMNRVVVADVLINGALLTTYHADGVMVATATGSTAYALAAGGPIVDPRSQALILVSVAAHLTNVPSMVLHENSEISIVLQGRYNAELVVDGRDNITLQEHDIVRVRRSERVCIFARVHSPNHFYAGLSRRLRRE